MNEPNKPEESLADEFRNLGENLINAISAAWERPERKKLQQEIEDGLAELTQTLKKEAETFKESETGKQFKSDVEDLRRRVRTGEAETAVRSELLNALKIINTELKKATSNIQEEKSSPNEAKPPESPDSKQA